jgi:5-methylcytosine-specific restriction protein A
MADAPLHQCAEAGCRQLIRGASRCPAHAKEASKRTSGSTDPFYQSRAWKDLRNAFIAEHPLCAACEATGRTTPGFIVDHIIERADDPSLELEWSNLQTMCLSCHSRKTRIEAASRRRKSLFSK